MSGLLECHKLCKYFGGLKAVDGVDLSIEQGDIFGIIGPNGAGKTTLFNVCAGVFAPTSGRILFDGKPISGRSPDKIANLGITRTFQNIKLFWDMSVLENVKLGAHIRMKGNLADAILHTKRYRQDESYAAEKGMEVLRRVGLEDHAEFTAGNLPYGLQRKLEIARALAPDPKILLLDEPAAGMNPSETAELMKLIQSLNADGLTVVVIEHDMKFVMSLCRHLAVINFGRKIAEGTPEEVAADEEVQRAYLGDAQRRKRAI